MNCKYLDFCKNKEIYGDNLENCIQHKHICNIEKVIDLKDNQLQEQKQKYDDREKDVIELIENTRRKIEDELSKHYSVTPMLECDKIINKLLKSIKANKEQGK